MQQDWRGLSLRQKIGQTMVIKADPAREIKEFGSIEAFLAKYPVGGIFLCRETMGGSTGKREDVLEIVRSYRESGPIPPLLVADAENGCSSLAGEMPSLPPLMALGAADSAELAYAYGRTIALQAAAIGLDWSLSPVVDLNLNPFNPITNTRAVGDQPERAIRLLTAVVRGMRDHGLLATAKHFPGDGVDYRDQHLVTTCNSLTREEWRRNHGLVFTAMIEAGVDAVMTGHISLPCYQSPAKGGYHPATLSRELTTRLLKEEMGFDGVVISDALDMGGFLKWYDRDRGELECFKAGTDMLLWPSLELMDRLERAVRTGEIPLDRLEDAVARIQRLKERHGLLAAYRRDPMIPTVEDLLLMEKTAQEVAEGGITLVRDRKKRLPLRREAAAKALIVAVTAHDPAIADMNVLRGELQARGLEVALKRNVTVGELAATHRDYDPIIYALMSRPHFPRGPLGFFGPEADSIWAALTSGAEKSIVVSFGSPYQGGEYFEAADIYLNAYSLEPSCQIAVVKAIFGEIVCAGRSPVRL